MYINNILHIFLTNNKINYPKKDEIANTFFTCWISRNFFQALSLTAD